MGVAEVAEEVGTSCGSAGWYRPEAELQAGYDERLVLGLNGRWPPGLNLTAPVQKWTLNN